MRFIALVRNPAPAIQMRTNGADILYDFGLASRIQTKSGLIVLGEQIVQSVQQRFAISGISNTDWTADR